MDIFKLGTLSHHSSANDRNAAGYRSEARMIEWFGWAWKCFLIRPRLRETGRLSSIIYNSVTCECPTPSFANKVAGSIIGSQTSNIRPLSTIGSSDTVGTGSPKMFVIQAQGVLQSNISVGILTRSHAILLLPSFCQSLPS